MTADADSELTHEQRFIVEQPANARLIVTAGAGTGKTFSLTRRLDFLIENEGLDAADILVLSFSRAAVREVHDRLRAYGEAAAHVDVRTFDSYATMLLAEADPDGSWQRKGFDQRIREATRLLREKSVAMELARETRHLVVDEVQDLVGERAELVKVLLTTILGGFTLLGDPAQGIYGFQLKDRRPEERIRGAAALYEWVRASFRSELVEATLTENFRAREPEAMVALRFGPDLGSVNADYANIGHDLRTELLTPGNDLGSLTDAISVIAQFEMPTAILCSTNGEALLVSRELHGRQISHRLQRSAQDRVLPSWVARVFFELESTRPPEGDVTAVLERTGASVGEAWTLLKRMDPNRRTRSLDLKAVRDRMSKGEVPDELTRQPTAILVVSTIHRAKGLEFDQVVVVDPGEARADRPIEQAEEARKLYVAMTRPRDLLMYIKSVDGFATGYLRQLYARRWVDCAFRNGGRFGMEIRGEDVHSEEPAGTVGFSAPVRETQEYLSGKVRTGDRISFIALTGAQPGRPPRYAVEHDGNYIGVTSEPFALALRNVLPGRNRRDWPSAVTDLYIDCMESVVGSEAAGINAGLGWSGVWLRPRIVGLGRFEWRRKTQA